ncbi:NYN domain-containing protein [Microcoleus vaginatus]|uniref:NYN domain-containing protein n=1 Tax=Microcoleus vaginatus TaxID=119532 RepID=UPI00020D10CE|nr:Domain of unknown function DUF88 [Microcoleus vaginatus FGP-2]
MTDNHPTSNPSTEQQQALVSIYWDYQNIPNAKQANNLLLFANSLGYVVNRKVYDNWQQGNKDSQKRTFVNLGFECVNVPHSIKNAADFSLSIDCYGEATSSLYPHLFIVLSGDGYCEILIPKLQNKGKKVIILARQGNERKSLKKLADKFYFVDEILNSI